MSGTYKYSMKTATVKMQMDGNIRGPGHSGVITAALAGNLVDDADILRAAPTMLAALKTCLAAETERRASLKPGAPATTYTEARIAQITEALALAEPVE